MIVATIWTAVIPNIIDRITVAAIIWTALDIALDLGGARTRQLAG